MDRSRPGQRRRAAAGIHLGRLSHAIVRGAIAGAGALALPHAAAQAQPAEAVRAYDVPAGPLTQALNRFGRDAGILLSFSTDQTDGLQTPGIRGSYSVPQALRALLAQSSLQAVQQPNGGYVLRAAAGSPVTQLPTVQVTGTAVDGALPPEYAGGQVASGGRVGLLGNKDFLDTPFSATQYTARLIEDQQAQNIGDVLVNDPSVRNTYARGAGRDEFNIRGFTLFNYDVSYNGLYGVSPRNASSLIGIERVEVLRGPNALLNGMAPYGSVGGSINLVPKRAGAEPLNRVTLSYMEDSQLGVHADVARRFGQAQQLGVRLNVQRAGGEMNIDHGKEDLGAFALGVDYRADRFRIEGDLNYQDRITDARSGLLFPPPAGTAIGRAPDASHNFFPSWTYWKAREWSGMVRAEYDLSNDWTVYGALGGRRHDFDSLQTSWLMLDGDGMIGAVPARLGESLASRTAEVGVRGRARTGPVMHEPSLSASVLAIDYESRRLRSSTVFSDLYEPVDLPKPDIARPSGLGKTSDTRLYSVALADTVSLLDKSVQLTAGLRHQRVQIVNFNADTNARTTDYGESAVTPALALTFRPTERLSLYGNYIEGLSQGATAPAGTLNAGETFAPAKSKQYEVGAKYDFGSFATTLSAFHIEQPSAYLDAGSMRYVADGRQRNRGLEFLVQGELSRSVRLLGGVAYTDGRLTRTEGGINDGRHAPAVPKFQFNAAVEWDTPFVDGLTLTTRMLRTSRQYVDAGNTQSLPGWTRFDVGARYATTIAGTPMVFRATVENVFNKDYWLSAAREGLTVAAPRTFLLSVSADF
ncbi:TonB-dependent receptor [Bordetella genomosp. 13]|uniref:TonB-dependent receptor n=1 Tax=Bordetella genomosp. 13 TaxID=463040 RepID=UPI0011A33E33|nr:TonB-dependent receptor [Bordetella genomosp. 13]